MSKNQDQEPINKIKQQLDAEYKNFTDLERFWAAFGIETGNTKYDELNKKYLDLNKGNFEYNTNNYPGG
ncbi:MAG TPA: hypothetical protein LFW14_02040 [Rickettsia endosymbiont of Degeeriella rufa]|nr:hypothetical protein [Rickettsia endosymbiont of Degeeriella rufa]